MQADPIAAFAGVVPGHLENPARHTSARQPEVHKLLFSKDELDRSWSIISAWPGYQTTRLVSLDGLAGALKVDQIRYKDEGNRFGLGSFKALGGAYAVSQLLSGQTSVSSTTVTSATDGNHGLSVAWGAKKHGCRCVIFIHAEVSAGREQALVSQGAEVVRIDGNYDDSVKLCRVTAQQNDWTVISDTANSDSESDVARTVMAGYSVMVAEIVEQLADDIPTHVFVQGGVGGLAATVCAYFHSTYEHAAPRFVVVEPERAACLYASAEKGCRIAVEIEQETVMAGLSCGEVSTVAWPVLKHYTDHFLTIPDSIVVPAMRLLYDAPFDNTPVIAGESAVAGLAALICARQNAGLAKSLRLDRHSRVLLIGTEGATDPDLFESLTGRSVVSVTNAKIRENLGSL